MISSHHNTPTLLLWLPVEGEADAACEQEGRARWWVGISALLHCPSARDFLSLHLFLQHLHKTVPEERTQKLKLSSGIAGLGSRSNFASPCVGGWGGLRDPGCHHWVPGRQRSGSTEGSTLACSMLRLPEKSPRTISKLAVAADERTTNCKVGSSRAELVNAFWGTEN